MSINHHWETLERFEERDIRYVAPVPSGTWYTKIPYVVVNLPSCSASNIKTWAGKFIDTSQSRSEKHPKMTFVAFMPGSESHELAVAFSAHERRREKVRTFTLEDVEELDSPHFPIVLTIRLLKHRCVTFD